MKLYRFPLAGFGEVLCSIPEASFKKNAPRWGEFLEPGVYYFSESRRLNVSPNERPDSPSSEFCKGLMNCVFEHFCTGTFAWFSEVLLEMESASLMDRPARLDKADILQLLAVIATLYDENSCPVLLYQVDSLV